MRRAQIQNVAAAEEARNRAHGRQAAPVRRLRSNVPREGHTEGAPQDPHGRHAVLLRVLRQVFPVQGNIDGECGPRVFCLYLN